MRWALATMLLAPACDLVYSLDRPPADAPPEPGTDEVRATFVRAVVGAEGGPVMDLTVDGVTASVVLANGARPEVVREGDMFRFAWTRDMTYYLTFDRPDRPPLTYVMNTETLSHGQRELVGDRPAPLPNTKLEATYQNLGSPDSLFLASTGTWVQGSSGVVSTFTLDFTERGIFLSGVPRILEAPDRVYCSAFDRVTDGGGGLTYVAMKRAASATVSMQNGNTTPFACVLEELVLDRCALMVIDRQGELARIRDAISPSFGQVWTWATIILAIPTPSFGPFAALRLAYENGNNDPQPFTGVLHYANPYGGHDGVAVHSVMVRQRFVMARGATQPIDLSVGTRQYYAPADDCGPSTAIASIAVPSPPAFGGVFLVDDDEVQLSRTRPVEVSWENRSPGDVDYYVVGLYELVADGIASRLVEQRSWVTTGTSLEIDSDVFAADRDYVMSVATVYAFTNAAAGDFRTQRWPAPIATATNYSGVFTVAR